MNILREFRRTKKISIMARIRLVLTFSVILIVNTYAWFNINEGVKIGGLQGEVTSWDVSYYVNEDENEILDETAIFTIDELYPGMPNREDIVRIYNRGKSSTSIKYELISIKVFGQEILEQLKAENGITTDGNTTHIFSDDTKYPFNISYTYDKTRLDGQYVDDETTPDAHATVKFNVNWAYEAGSDDNEKEARDILDTKFGKDAYNFYQNEENDSQKAVEIYVKITSSMIRGNK